MYSVIVTQKFYSITVPMHNCSSEDFPRWAVNLSLYRPGSGVWWGLWGWRSHVYAVMLTVRLLYLFRLTLRQSRPNKAGLDGPSIRTYVRVCVRTSVHTSTKSFFDFNGIWHVGRGRWVMHFNIFTLVHTDAVWPDPRSRCPWKLDILPFSKAISSAIYNASWQLTTDS